MPWQVRIEIRRHPALFPVPMSSETVSVMAETKVGALARAVAAVLPVADAAMPQLFRTMIGLRRDALAAGRVRMSPPGKAP